MKPQLFRRSGSRGTQVANRVCRAGAGAIGLEFSLRYAHLGSGVTIIGGPFARARE